MAPAARSIFLWLLATPLTVQLAAAQSPLTPSPKASGLADELTLECSELYTEAPATQPGISVVAAPATLPADPDMKFIRGQRRYWRLAQDHRGVWWFLSPDNRPEFLNMVSTVQPYQLGRDAIGPNFVSRDWNGGMTDNGEWDRWATTTLQRVRDTGFKGLGAWCNPVFHKHDVPMTRDLNIWTWIAAGSKRFYSPDWATTAEQAVKAQTTLLRDNRNLVGYYLDNELDWSDATCGPAAYFDLLPAEDPNRKQVVGVIQWVWRSVENFNRDWNTSLNSWTDLDLQPRLPEDRPVPYGRLFSAWLSRLAEDYFKTTTALVRKYDPNHLVLGVRFKGYAPLEVVRASRNFTDAQSLNYYPNDARLDAEMFQMMHQQSGQPVVVTEFSFHALDGRSGNRNTVGFAGQVLDQRARADGYKLLVSRLARVPYVVGADWFQWMDEPPSGRPHDGEDVNFGIVDIDDRPYEALAEAVRTTGPLLNGLHQASHSGDQQDVWRESFADKPVMHVPRLDGTIRLNGELSDWSPASKLPGVRHSRTIGLERSPLPLPNIHLGWTQQGLYLGMEVFDNDIQGAPAKGWWWTRDNVEFWINTRPVGSDQNGFDVFSHQFFFVPQEFPANDGAAGVVGQWHRPGDALKDHKIPHGDVKVAVRVLADRYVVEMFIPGVALHGWDPIKQPALAFNIHVRNFQHATDYFWSAPKEVMTQLRPNTWGPMYLVNENPQAPVAAQAMATPAARP